MERTPVPELELSYYGLADADMSREFSPGSWQGVNGRVKLSDIVAAVKKTYCGTIGIEYMYISSTDEKRWIQKRFEGTLSTPSFDAGRKKWILERITASETLERYLHTRYVGQKRFSGEGGESLIPMLDTVIENTGAHGAKEVVIGMAHRGRLNVLVNTLGKIPAELFSEFEGKHAHELSSGDVKYHQGFSRHQDRGAPCTSRPLHPAHWNGPRVRRGARAPHRGGDIPAKRCCRAIQAMPPSRGRACDRNMAFADARLQTEPRAHLVNNQIGFTRRIPASALLAVLPESRRIEAPVFHGTRRARACVFVRHRREYRTSSQGRVIDLVASAPRHNEHDEPFSPRRCTRDRAASRHLSSTRTSSSRGVVPAARRRDVTACARAGRGQGTTRNPTAVKVPPSIDWGAVIGVDWRTPRDRGRAGALSARAAITKFPPLQAASVGRRLLTRAARWPTAAALDWGMAANPPTHARARAIRALSDRRGARHFRSPPRRANDNREKWDAGSTAGRTSAGRATSCDDSLLRRSGLGE